MFEGVVDSWSDAEIGVAVLIFALGILIICLVCIVKILHYLLKVLKFSCDLTMHITFRSVFIDMAGSCKHEYCIAKPLGTVLYGVDSVTLNTSSLWPMVQ